MSKKSAGLLMYRVIHGLVEIFLVHPGGPFWAKKDDGSWSIPKGEFSGEENPLKAAKREVKEETGFVIEGDFKPLDPVRQPSGKIVYVWAVKSDVDAMAIKSDTFSVEWPPKSGKVKEFPEVDRAEWFTIEMAKVKIVKGQVFFLDQLERMELV